MQTARLVIMTLNPYDFVTRTQAVTGTDILTLNLGAGGVPPFGSHQGPIDLVPPKGKAGEGQCRDTQNRA